MRWRTARKESPRSISRESKELERSSSPAPERGGRMTTRPWARRTGNRQRLRPQIQTRQTRMRRVVTALARMVTPRVATTRARTTSRGRHCALPIACTRRNGRRGGGRASQTRRACRGRRPTTTMPLIRQGPLPAWRSPVAPLKAGGLPQTPQQAGWNSRRGTNRGRPPTRSEHTCRRTRRGGFYRPQCNRSRHRSSTGDGSSRKRRAHNHIPLLTWSQQTEDPLGKVM